MTNPESVRWAEMRPDQFRARRDARPVVYLPLGLCEPHGHIAALGLDLLKADHYCDEAARRFGGIVAPSQGYHIHESGFHASWLAEVVGEENPLMAALPPHVMLRLFLYQLRAFALAGFRAVVAVSGHAGGSQEDLRTVAERFSRHTGIPVVVRADPELVQGKFTGDHAGRYEISQLLAIAPERVDLGLLGRARAPGSGGRLALGDNAGEATAGFGREINEAIIAALGEIVATLARQLAASPSMPALDYATVESLWREIEAELPRWRSVARKPGQAPAPAGSRWATYQDVAAVLRSPAASP